MRSTILDSVENTEACHFNRDIHHIKLYDILYVHFTTEKASTGVGNTCFEFMTSNYIHGRMVHSERNDTIADSDSFIRSCPKNDKKNNNQAVSCSPIRHKLGPNKGSYHHPLMPRAFPVAPAPRDATSMRTKNTRALLNLVSLPRSHWPR